MALFTHSDGAKSDAVKRQEYKMCFQSGERRWFLEWPLVYEIYSRRQASLGWAQGAETHSQRRVLL